ncbi:4'-phosphopantetheinyl transferase family protein [Paraburkholderia sp.]|uniref:4'-phosphopantetheinyl transferase family protein n=1 Tax=Paraburkholderia sp. TaxID=1926495 RepID=UPI003D6EA9CD
MAVRPVRIAAQHRWPADVEVWRVPVPTDPAALVPLHGSVDDAERERAGRYRQFADRARFLAARVALRTLLAGRIGEAPHALRFTTGRYGRPALDGYPALSFNVSHAGEHALIAISAGRVVGVDIERVDRALDWRPLADLVCTPDERRALDSSATAQQLSGFLLSWTAKEALLKALGLGIAEGLQCIAVDPFADGLQRPSAQPGSIAADADRLRFHWIDGIDGYAACVAYGERYDGAVDADAHVPHTLGDSIE